MRPSRSIPIFSRLVSTQVTSTPISAKQAPDTSPTYPVPTIVIFIRRGYLSMAATSPARRRQLSAHAAWE